MPTPAGQSYELLRRPELTRKFRNLESMDISSVMELVGRAEVVELDTPTSVSRDPKDDKFLDTAKAAAADYLVSADDDLLDIREYEGTKIVDAATFLAILDEGERE